MRHDSTHKPSESEQRNDYAVTMILLAVKAE